MSELVLSKSGSVFGGALLVAGTSIGGGMLALPVLTSLGGFLPSLVIYLLCWLFMTCTGLLFLEVCHWMEGESNIISMAERTLGTGGKVFAWGIYLFLFYCLTLAYVVGSGDLVVQLSGGTLSEWTGSLIFIAVFAPFLFAGARVVGRLNVLLMFGLALSYVIFVFMGYGYVNTEFLVERNWSLSLVALPISFVSFAYQGIIPTLSSYMHHDIKKTRTAILIGSSIPFATYIVWQWLILGIVPTYGAGGLAETLASGNNAIQPLKTFIENPHVYVVGQYFAFFALTTSFFGVTLGLFDFLADGLKIEKNTQGKILLCAIIFIPPIMLASTSPHIFLDALEYAGGYGAALLLGLLPVLMVWSGRYRLGLKSTYSLPGGRWLLAILAAFVLFEVVCELGMTYLKFTN